MAVWAGIIIGVSLIATPVKFQAPSLTIQTGLEIGRYTFRLLARVEVYFLIAAIVIAAVARPPWFTVVVLAIVAIAIALQRFWLLPNLDQRVSQVLAGCPPSFSIHHSIYAVLEATKAGMLIAGAVVPCRSQFR